MIGQALYKCNWNNELHPYYRSMPLASIIKIARRDRVQRAAEKA
jgi:hypothetical protein